MTSISKNVYIDKLDDILNEYNNTYHRTIKMKSIDVKDNTYINIDEKVEKIKSMKNISKSCQSFQEKSRVQKEIPPPHKLLDHENE